MENVGDISGKCTSQESNHKDIREGNKSKDKTESSNETNYSNGTVDSQGLTKSEREVFDLNSVDLDKENTSNYTTDEDSIDDLKVPVNDDDLTSDDIDSVKSFTTEVSETNENEYKTAKSELEIEQICYQNALMLGRLEQAELNEDIIRKENKINEEQLRNKNEKLLRKNEAIQLQNKHKISCLEKALKKKTEILIAALKEKS